MGKKGDIKGVGILAKQFADLIGGFLLKSGQGHQRSSVGDEEIDQRQSYMQCQG